MKKLQDEHEQVALRTTINPDRQTGLPESGSPSLRLFTSLTHHPGCSGGGCSGQIEDCFWVK